jgi:hypothetical protein
MASQAFIHLVDNFLRDYFIEWIEHATENTLTTGMYPHPSLGPGQRFASKGGYILKPSDKTQGGLGPIGDWIVP